MVKRRRNLLIAILTAAVLWFWMFSPWTKGLTNFWVVMMCAAAILTTLAILFTPREERRFTIEKPWLQLVGGVVLAFVLWGIFWVGDKASQWLFDFARPEVDAVYSMKTGLPVWLIGLMLLFVIGPAEEFFWRGYVQKNLSQIFGGKRAADCAFITTAIIYALVHIWSFNFMLIMAALVAGLVWGLVYRLWPKALPALIVSHAVWDLLVFVLLPL